MRKLLICAAIAAAFAAPAEAQFTPPAADRTLWTVPMDGQLFAPDGHEITHGTFASMFVETPREWGTFTASEVIVKWPFAPMALSLDFTVTTRYFDDSFSVQQIQIDGLAGSWLFAAATRPVGGWPIFYGTTATYVGPDGDSSGWSGWDHVQALNRPDPPTTAVLDASISAVPEPETYALLLAGFGLLALRRRVKRD